MSIRRTVSRGEEEERGEAEFRFAGKEDQDEKERRQENHRSHKLFDVPRTMLTPAKIVVRKK